MLAEKGIGYVDAGVSGGVWGLQNGYALMVGGDPDDVAKVQPAFDTLKPAEGGFVHAGKVGAGHFAKMVHNGIEYGIMQAYGEGYELLETSDLVTDVPDVFRQLDAGHRDPVLAARPAGPRAGRGPGPDQDPRLRRGLRRGPVDGGGGDRARGADAGHRGRAVRPVRQPAGRLAGDEGGRRAAQPVRRARHQGRRRARPGRHPGDHRQRPRRRRPAPGG